MRIIDTSFSGGMPFVQETIDFQQDAALEIVIALLKAGFDGTNPIIVSGCEYDQGTGDLAAGWIFDGTNLVRMVAGNTGTAGTSMIKIQNLATTAVFEDLSVKDLYVEQTYVLDVTGTIDFVDLKRFQYVFGNTRPPSGLGSPYEVTLAPSAGTPGVPLGSFVGNILYFNKTMKITGSIQVSDAQALPAGCHYQTVATLAADFRPSQDVPFTAYIRCHDTAYILEDNSTEHITQINAELKSNGQLNFGWIKPDTGIANYTVYFNCIIPL